MLETTLQCLHTACTRPLTKTTPHHSTDRTSRRSDGSSSCLDESSPQWLPAEHPRYTRANTTEKNVDSSHTAQRVPSTTCLNMVAEKERPRHHDYLHDSPISETSPRATNPRTGGRRPENRHDQASSRTRTVWTTLVMCTSARRTSTSARKIR